MGCGGSKGADVDKGATAPPKMDADDMGFIACGNPLQNQGGMVQMPSGPSWRAASEPTMEDMRKQRLLISNFDSLVQKLRAGRKEHEFVSCLSDIELFCELKPHDVPAEAGRLLMDARDSLLRNARRGQFWRRKAALAFKACVAKLPVKMGLGDFTAPSPGGGDGDGDDADGGGGGGGGDDDAGVDSGRTGGGDGDEGGGTPRATRSSSSRSRSSSRRESPTASSAVVAGTGADGYGYGGTDGEPPAE